MDTRKLAHCLSDLFKKTDGRTGSNIKRFNLAEMRNFNLVGRKRHEIIGQSTPFMAKQPDQGAIEITVINCFAGVGTGSQHWETRQCQQTSRSTCS